MLKEWQSIEAVCEKEKNTELWLLNSIMINAMENVKETTQFINSKFFVECTSGELLLDYKSVRWNQGKKKTITLGTWRGHGI